MLAISSSLIKKLVTGAFAVLAITLLPVRAAYADDFSYVFSGTASGSIIGPTALTSSTFTDAAFTVTFDENTSTLISSGGYSSYNGVDATFTEGSKTLTLTNATLEVNGNSTFQNVDFYNSTFLNGLGIYDLTPVGYDLTTGLTIPVSNTNLSPTLSGGSFTTTGLDHVQFTADSTLGFTATDLTTAPTPEPSSLLLIATGLSGLGLAMRRRFCL